MGGIHRIVKTRINVTVKAKTDTNTFTFQPGNCLQVHLNGNINL